MKKITSITIDQQRCTGCGLCVSDCVAKNLYLIDGRAAYKSSVCMECGHCFAICPAEAIDMPEYDTVDCRELGSLAEIDSDKLLLAMKSRRSIRQFRDEPVEEEKLLKVIEAGRYAPTAKNSQDISYIVLQDSLAQMETAAGTLFQRLQKKAGALSAPLKDVVIDEHFFFKGGKAAILTVSQSPLDAGLASSYMELMAESLGLGVLYSGFFVAAVRLGKEIRQELGLDKEEQVVSCLVLGYPDVGYQRIVPRRPAKIKMK